MMQTKKQKKNNVSIKNITCKIKACSPGHILRMNKRKACIAIQMICVICLAIDTSAQDIEKISESKAIGYSGGVNITQTAYGASGMESRRDPYSWVVNANLNLTLFGVIDAPFSAHFTNENRTYNQPNFNHFGVSPKYKFITGHFGYRSMRFSNYSLSGITFLGGGVEVKPKDSWIEFSAMYGKFAKAIPFKEDYERYASNNRFDAPGYERWGYGGKVTMKKQQQQLSLLMFKASDDPNSIPDPGTESGITPKENLVLGVRSSNQIYKKVTLKTEYTLSALSSDMRMPERKMETFSYLNNFGPLYTPRYSTSVNSAFKAGVNYQTNAYSVGVDYKYIDPGYKSLGTTYMANDVEDILLNMSKSFLNGKINLSGNIGRQRNNLNNQLTTTNKRVIGGINGSFSITNSLNVSANYSNFNSSTQPSAISIRDTFSYAQVTKNTGLTINYNTGNEDNQHGIMLNTTYQIVNTLNETATELRDIGTDLYNTNLAYSLTHVPQNVTLAASINYNYFIQEESMKNISVGPTLTISKALFDKKARTSIAYSYFDNQAPNNFGYHMNMVRLGGSYKINASQSLRLTSSMMFKRLKNSENGNPVNEEYRARLTYNYGF